MRDNLQCPLRLAPAHGGHEELNLHGELHSSSSPRILVFWATQHLELLCPVGQGESGSRIWLCIRKFLTISIYIDFVKHHVCEFLSRHRFIAPVDGSNSLEGKKDTGVL